MKSFIRLHAWDFVLTFFISLGLCLNLFSAWVIRDQYTKNYVLIVIAILAVNALMYVIGYSKKTAMAGGIGWLVFTVVWVLFMRSQGWLTFNEEIDKSVPVFWSILLYATALVFLLTRNRKVLLGVLPFGLLVLAAFRFLEYPVSVPGLFIFVAAAALEVLYKVYMDSLMTASYGNFRVRHFIEQSVAVVAAVGVLASGVYYGVVKPLDPPTRDLKLITKLLSFDILETLGVSWTQQIEDPDLTTDEENDEEQDTKNKDQENEDNKEQNDEQNDEDDKNDRTEQSEDTVSTHSITYNEKDYTPVIVTLIVLLLLALPFAIKYGLRRRFRKTVFGLSPSEQVKTLFAFFLNRFRRLGMGKEDGHTLQEYTEDHAAAHLAFATEEGTRFENLSDIVSDMLYAGYEPNETDAAKFRSFYKEFYKHARERVGKWKYLLKFWTI